MQVIDSVLICLQKPTFRANLLPKLLGHLRVRSQMRRLPRLLLVFVVFAAFAHSAAEASERRLALVIGNGSYGVGPLPSAVNDAALIAQTLIASGFEVTSQRDLDEVNLRQGFGDFLSKVKNAGPDTVVAVYFAGLALQCEGENYLLPLNAQVGQPSDLVHHALSLTEQIHSLAALHVKASFVIIDGARASPFLLAGRPPASGLSWMETQPNLLIAFSATPGTVAPESAASRGMYALALTEMIRQGGLGPGEVFDRVRLRVNELTGGAQVPWDASNIQSRFQFSEAGAGVPPRADAPARTAGMRSQPMRKLSPQDAYWTALLRDTFDGYAEFLAEYWNYPMARRIEALLAVRREAITWHRTFQANVADAYWTYLELYPHGPHVGDAERMLTHLAAATTPPAKFTRLDYDVPPPLPAEAEFTEPAVLTLGDPEFAFAPLKPPPGYFLQAAPSQQQVLVQPAAPSGEPALPRQGRLTSSQAADVAGGVANGTGAATNAAVKSDKPTMREGQGGSLSLSGAAGLGIERPTNANQGSRFASRIGGPGSAAPAAVQSGPSVQANAAPEPPLPAWASFLPRDTKSSGPLPPAASNRPAQPLFVSSGLAPVLPLAARRAGTAMVAKPPPHWPLLATAPAHLPGGSTQPPTTGSIAAGRPKAVTLPAQAHTPPVSAQATTGNIVPPGTRPAARSTGAQARPPRSPGQAVQNTALPGTRAASLTPSVVNRPKAARGTAQPPKAADQGARQAARKENPEAPISLVPGPASAASRPQSEKNPCSVSNGRLDCGD
ncbi:MAG TPA: caspase family protein [Bradyrhizobium sp.]|nr:caspase family protein [Bradyrhizobium sp.]